MDTLHRINPFSKREDVSRSNVIAYKVVTILSWLLVVLTTVFYSVHKPTEGKYHRRTIWGQNKAYPTPFALNEPITSIYWVIVWALQLGYVWHLFSTNTEYVTSAANVGSHFVANNLLQFGWVMLWSRSHFWWAELLLIVNFFNLASLYFRHSNYARFIHIPVVSAPLAWTFVAIFWNGAVMVNAHTLVARIFANIAIWGILVFGLFFLVVFKDYTIGFELSVLSASLGVGQFLTKVIAFQWIFAFTIMATLFVFSILVSVPGLTDGKFTFRRGGAGVSEDRERQPLLDDH
ncbi:MAG: hypothetical protein M1824_003268 [Vezdaea acicularis]|nr:MAG: hypothetical protein M1824_003268 [Vezdaea acicularis]